MFFKKKGQVGLEFVLVTMVAFSTLIVFSLVLFNIMSSKQDEKRFILAEDLALSIKQEISFASNAEKGYSRIVNLPKNIEGANYEITLGVTSINTGYFELEIDNSVFFEIIPLTSGTIEPGRIKISKREADVFVEVLP
ncbi:hypothetical protein KO361_03295 [Candidatus Woesearchaeota archaeon]|jgi:uncharacterized protein (UPF0333 family)|nr:hypothetical protein [Candidatus Woesearchaeota archaeon]